jgi:hypothetical protein
MSELRAAFALVCGLAGAAAGLLVALAPDPPAPPPPTATAAPAAEPRSPSGTAVAREFPGIKVFTAERRLEVDAAFDIVEDSVFLEYLAVAPHGKLHESLLEIRCAPEHLQAGLYLLGLKEPRPAEVQWQGDPAPPSGPRVAIEAEWQEPGGVRHRERVESLLYDARLGREMDEVGFAFTGSRFIARGHGSQAGVHGPPPPDRPGKPGAPAEPEVFAASASGSVIAVYHDPDAVLDNPLVSGGDVPLLAPTFRLVEIVTWVPGDERLRPNAAKLPPHGTPCKLHMRPL